MTTAQARPVSGAIRVLVDASSIRPNQGGIRSYTLGLVRALAARPELSVAVATGHPEDYPPETGVDVYRIRAQVDDPLRRALWREARVRGLVQRTGAQLLLIPLHEHPLRDPGVPTVMVMHDLGPLVAPAVYGRTRFVRYAATLPRATKSATAIVNMSYATQADLFKTLGVDLEKCRVIETGTQGLPAAGGTPAPVEGDFVLYVGTLWPHKNVETVIRAFAGDDGRLPFKLVLAGPHEPDEQDRMRDAARRHGLADDRIELLGYVPVATLAALYRDAVACVLPSLHEGFGAPLVEAMRLGKPFVASDIPAHREVGGDAALFVSEVFSPAAWRDAIATVAAYGDKDLRRVARKGKARAALYSWDRVAQDWVELIGSLVPRAA